MGSVPVPVSIGFLVALLLVVWGAMLLGWRRQRARAVPLVTELPQPPGDLGTARSAQVPAVYVTSTTSGDWLARVSTRSLGFRSRATVQVFDAGVMIWRKGAADVFVPVASLRGVRRTSGMAGKFVGDGSIVVLTWDIPGEAGELDTGLRPDHRHDRDLLEQAVASLLPADASAPHDPKEQS